MCKGVGTGLCGLIVSPLTCCLRCCTTFSQGVNRTAIAIKTGKLPTYGRFRFPRYINPRMVLEPYDEGYSHANHVLFTVKNGKFAKENIVYFQEFVQYNGFKRTNKDCTLIITDNWLFFVRGQNSLLYKTKVKEVDRTELYEGGEDEKAKSKLYHLYIMRENNRNYVVRALRYPKLDKAYNMIYRQLVKHQEIE